MFSLKYCTSSVMFSVCILDNSKEKTQHKNHQRVVSVWMISYSIIKERLYTIILIEVRDRDGWEMHWTLCLRLTDVVAVVIYASEEFTMQMRVDGMLEIKSNYLVITDRVRDKEFLKVFIWFLSAPFLSAHSFSLKVTFCNKCLFLLKCYPFYSICCCVSDSKLQYIVILKTFLTTRL